MVVVVVVAAVVIVVLVFWYGIQGTGTISWAVDTRHKSFDISAEFSAKCAQRSRPVQTIAYLPARVIEEMTARDLELATGPCCLSLLCIVMLSYVFMLS